MIHILLVALAVALLLGVIWWALDFFGVPQPINKFAKGFCVIVVVIWIVMLLTGYSSSMGLR